MLEGQVQRGWPDPIFTATRDGGLAEGAAPAEVGAFTGQPDEARYYALGVLVAG